MFSSVRHQVSDDNRIEAVGIGDEICGAGNDVMQGFIGALFEVRIASLDHDAACVTAAGKQHGQINRGSHTANAVDMAQPVGESAVFGDAFRAGMREIDVRGHTKQAILDWPGESPYSWPGRPPASPPPAAIPMTENSGNITRRRTTQVYRGDRKYRRATSQANLIFGREPEFFEPLEWFRKNVLQRISRFLLRFLPDARLFRPDSASGRSSGNKITSRMEWESVNSMVSRSMPMPSPAVGGMPCASARM